MLIKRLAIGVALIATLVLAFAYLNRGSNTSTISGRLTLEGGDKYGLRDFDSEKGPCYGASGRFGARGYSDINAGTTVLISNEKGTIIATGKLGTGSKRIDEDSCKFPYKVTGVPAAKIYSIEVSDRGKLTYSLSDLKKNNWKANLTLG